MIQLRIADRGVRSADWSPGYPRSVLRRVRRSLLRGPMLGASRVAKLYAVRRLPFRATLLNLL